MRSLLGSTGSRLVRSECRERLMRRFRGQSSVEYAIVFAAFLAMVVGLGAVANLLESGLVLEHALQSASHHLSNVLFSSFMRPSSDVAFGGVRLWCFARKALFFLRFLPWSVDG